MVTNFEFKNIPIRDAYGNYGEILSGYFTIQELTDHLVKNWVAYVECHQCPRVDSCRFVEPHPHYAHKKKEIRCGVKATALQNFLKQIAEFLAKGTAHEQEQILSAAYFLSEYALSAEQRIGMILSDDWISWMGKFSPSLFGLVTHDRILLDQLAQSLRKLDKLYHHQSVLLVEGQSERAFLDELRHTHISALVDARIEVYGGAGNLNPKRLQMRLEKYIEDGYVCHMQGDKDGKSHSQFSTLIRRGVVEKHNTFEFTLDFESSIPPDLLLEALHELGQLSHIGLEEFSRSLPPGISVTKSIITNWALDIGPLKVELAKEIGWIICQQQFKYLYQNDEFRNNTELGQFIEFVLRMDSR